MLKILGITDFDRYGNAVPDGIEFMQDGGDSEAVVVWLGLCKEEIEEQNDTENSPEYSKKDFVDAISYLKDVASNTDFMASLKSCRMLLNSVGVYLVYRPAIANAKVRGALTYYLGHPTIYISGRYKTHGDAWFAIAHEIGHLLDGLGQKGTDISIDDPKFKSSDEDDARANVYARKFFVDEDSYQSFASTGDFSSAAVKSFAASQGTPPGIVVAFLQHDGFVPFAELNDLKDRFN